jgi:ubiquitin-protein ligase E3 A
VSHEIIEMFRPEELELLVCGSRVLDFKELESATKYVDGYTYENKIITWFWEIIHNDMTEEEKKLFL